MTLIDLPALRDWIGRTSESRDSLSPRVVAQFRATLGPHLFGDESAVPLALHWCLSAPNTALAELGADGHPLRGGGALPPVPLPRRMWAGGEIELIAPLLLGDEVTRISEVTDVSIKDGRSGTLCFVTVTHTYGTDRGIAVRERQDIVYRDAAAGPAPRSIGTKAVALVPAELTWTIEASSSLLFRYSALTFNTHRIHYDLPYATDVEFYPGLVVHGPLQATILLNLAATLAGSPPRRFAYRGQAPLISGPVFVARANRTSPLTIECGVLDAAGVPTMNATASWSRSSTP
jgi:3-methylfumaryl-CoA hydratase